MSIRRKLDEMISPDDGTDDEDFCGFEAKVDSILSPTEQELIGLRIFLVLVQIARNSYSCERVAAKKLFIKSLYWQYNCRYRLYIRERVTETIQEMRRRDVQQATPGFAETTTTTVDVSRNTQLTNSHNSDASVNDQVVDNCGRFQHDNNADLVDCYNRDNAQQILIPATMIKQEPEDEYEDEEMHDIQNDDDVVEINDDDEDGERIDDDGEEEEEEEEEEVDGEEREDEDEVESVDDGSNCAAFVHELRDSSAEGSRGSRSRSESSSSSNNDTEMHDDEKSKNRPPPPMSPSPPPPNPPPNPPPYPNPYPIPYPNPYPPLQPPRRDEVDDIMNAIHYDWNYQYEEQIQYAVPPHAVFIPTNNYAYHTPYAGDMQQNYMHMPKIEKVVSLSSDGEEKAEKAATANKKTAENQMPAAINDITKLPVQEKKQTAQDIKELLKILTDDNNSEKNDKNEKNENKTSQNINHNNVEAENDPKKANEENYLSELFEKADYESACNDFMNFLTEGVNKIEQEIKAKDQEVLQLLRQKHHKLLVKERVKRFLNQQREMQLHNETSRNSTQNNSDEADKSKEQKVSSSQDSLKDVAAVTSNKVQQAVKQDGQQAQNFLPPPELMHFDELPSTSTGRRTQNLPALPPKSQDSLKDVAAVTSNKVQQAVKQKGQQAQNFLPPPELMHFDELPSTSTGRRTQNLPALPPKSPVIHLSIKQPPSSSSDSSSEDYDDEDTLINLLMESKKRKRKQRKQKMLKRLVKVCQPSKKKKKFKYEQQEADPSDSAAQIMLCDYCFSNEALFACGKCHKSFYCTDRCQQLDYLSHYEFC